MSLNDYSRRTNYVPAPNTNGFVPGPITLYFRRHPEVLLEIAAARKKDPPTGLEHVASYLREDPDLPEHIDVSRKRLASWWSNQGRRELVKLPEAPPPDGDNAEPFARAVEV